MASFGTISGKQLTVPDEVFDGLGLHDGDRVEFAQKDGEFVLRPLKPYVDRVQEWAGALAITQEEYVDWYREIKGRDPAFLGGAEIKD